MMIGTIEIGPYTYAGTYTIAYVSLEDNADNYISYYGKGSEYYFEEENKLPNALSELSFMVVQDSPTISTITIQP